MKSDGSTAHFKKWKAMGEFWLFNFPKPHSKQAQWRQSIYNLDFEISHQIDMCYFIKD